MLSLSGISPALGEKFVDPGSTIEFTIVDDGNGIDISTLIVEVRGFRALVGTTFSDGYNGTASSIISTGDNFIISIDPESDFPLGSVIGIKIQVKDLTGDYFNSNYSFKILPNEPILISSSPIDKTTLTSPQILELEFEDTIDNINIASINIDINGLNYIINGIIETEPNGLATDITATTDGVVVRIDPDEALKDGPYILTYSIADSPGNILRGRLRFTVDLPEAVLPSNFSQSKFLGFFQGIHRVSDIGCCDSLLIEWNKPINKSYNYDSFALVYENEYRLELFEEGPSYLATENITQATITGLKTGKTKSYGARALELVAGVFDPTGMVIVDNEFYRLPNSTALVIPMGTTDFTVSVSSTDGYPSKGLLIIGREVLRYDSISSVTNTFNIPPNGRSLLGSTAEVYVSGDEVKLFLNCTDENSVIIMATPTCHDGYASGRALDYEGVVITDYSDNDMRFFEGFDFCGYHQALPQNVLEGIDDCGSYLGGEFNGMRGFNLYNRMLNREEMLLDQVGEPSILLKRIWNGEICSCMDLRKMSPKLKSCKECFGTSFTGGYTQFINLRRADRALMLSFDETPEDLIHGEKEHLMQEYEPNAWTLPMPAIRDRDVIIRLDFTGDIEFIYEVLDVSREKIMFSKFGRQRLKLKRMDKTDILYTYNIISN
jgi:methionine-rich copper-binding protein CopC